MSIVFVLASRETYIFLYLGITFESFGVFLCCSVDNLASRCPHESLRVIPDCLKDMFHVDYSERFFYCVYKLCMSVCLLFHVKRTVFLREYMCITLFLFYAFTGFLFIFVYY